MYKRSKKMDYVFICKNCGNSQKYDQLTGTIDLKCSECGKPLNWVNAFPPQTALNFSHTTKELYLLSKNRDKGNLDSQYELLKKEGITIDKTTLDKYINKYESCLEKHQYNNDQIWIEIYDEIEEDFIEELGSDIGITIFSVIKIFSKNEFRTAYIIILASQIEQLFHNYFTELLKLKLTEYGRIKFLEKYEVAGIQSVIDISNSFLDESITNKMDRYSKGFSDRWKSLRELRNSIVHSNDKYISKVRLSKIKQLEDESYKVFLGLKKELYHQ